MSYRTVRALNAIEKRQMAEVFYTFHVDSWMTDAIVFAMDHVGPRRALYPK